MLLPPEVRNHVYGYLLDEGYAVQLTLYYYPLTHWARRSKYSTGLAATTPELRFYNTYARSHGYPQPSCSGFLRTNRQAYREIKSLLYANTNFRYVRENADQGSRVFLRTLPLPPQTLQHIQNLDIIVERHQNARVVVPTHTIAVLVNEACTLKRLTLSFELKCGQCLHSNERCRAEEQTPIYRDPALEAIEDSKSLRLVRVVAFGGYVGCWDDHFRPLSQAIATSKGWVCEEQEYRQEFRTQYDHLDERPAWVWHLYAAGQKPTTEGIMGLFPKRDIQGLNGDWAGR